jgi:hypothetical protein
MGEGYGATCGRGIWGQLVAVAYGVFNLSYLEGQIVGKLIIGVVVTGILVTGCFISDAVALPIGQKASTEEKAQQDSNEVRYRLLEKNLPKESPVKIPARFEKELAFSIKGLAAFCKTGKVDDEGMKTLALLKMRGAFAYRYGEMKWCRLTKKESSVMDKALLSLIESCEEHGLWGTAKMCYRELSVEARKKTDVLSGIISATISLGDEDRIFSLLREFFYDDKLNRSLHHGFFLLRKPHSKIAVPEAVSSDLEKKAAVVIMQSMAGCFVCRERSKLLQAGWWRYFDHFLEERRVGYPLMMEVYQDEGPNCLEVQKCLREEGFIYDDCLPIGGCVLVQMKDKDLDVTTDSIRCNSHGFPEFKHTERDGGFLLENLFSEETLSEILSKGFRELVGDGDKVLDSAINVIRDGINADNKKSGFTDIEVTTERVARLLKPSQTDCYTGALVWSLTHRADISDEILAASINLLESDLHTGYKCMVLKALIPALARNEIKSDRLSSWLKKTVSLGKYKMMEAYAAASLIALYGQDYGLLKDVVFSEKVDEGLKSMSLPLSSWEHCQRRFDKWEDITSQKIREIRNLD